MDLLEYQAKRLFARFEIPVMDGHVARTAQEARAIAEAGGVPMVVKAQVLTGGRGKAGGVKLAATPDEVESRAHAILGMQIKGHIVREVLITPAVDIAAEVYLGITLDRALRRPVLMASRSGGVDIEDVAARDPAAILRVPVEPLVGLQPYQVRQVTFGLGLPSEHTEALARIIRGLYHAYDSLDASLVEINPLAVTSSGLVALDGKVTIDDSALYRQEEVAAWRDLDSEPDVERLAREAGLSFVALDGNIGCMVNGAGLAMATMDVIQFFGGEPANFLDIGGGAQQDRVELAMRLILRDPRVQTVLVNIFGGITRCDEVARGIVAALANVDTRVPFVVRLVGTNAAEGRAILASASMHAVTTLAEAAQVAARLAQGQEVRA
jgi:succinyl-CoA synthetase beta subunit